MGRLDWQNHPERMEGPNRSSVPGLFQMHDMPPENAAISEFVACTHVLCLLSETFGIPGGTQKARCLLQRGLSLDARRAVLAA